MSELRLSYTKAGKPMQTDYGRLYPVNVCRDGTCPTLRAQSSGSVKNMLDIDHFSQLGILIKYGKTIKF